MAGSARGSEGATAVEFSLIAILLFTLLLGIVQFGLTYNRQQGLHAAAREGARLASLGNTVEPVDVRARVSEAAPSFIIDRRWSGDGGHLDILIEGIDVNDASFPETDFCTDHNGDGRVDDERVRVAVSITSTAQGQYNFGLPLIGVVIPDLSTSATFQCEQERGP